MVVGDGGGHGWAPIVSGGARRRAERSSLWESWVKQEEEEEASEARGIAASAGRTI